MFLITEFLDIKQGCEYAFDFRIYQSSKYTKGSEYGKVTQGFEQKNSW